MTYTARYMVYGSLQETECDSELEALRLLIHMEDNGECASRAIAGPDGSVTMDVDAIHQAFDEWDYSSDAPILEGAAIDVTNQRQIGAGT